LYCVFNGKPLFTHFARQVEGLKITPLLVHHGFVGNEPYTSMGFKFGMSFPT